MSFNNLLLPVSFYEDFCKVNTSTEACKNANALFCQIMLMSMHCFLNLIMPMLMLQISFNANDNAFLC